MRLLCALSYDQITLLFCRNLVIEKLCFLTCIHLIDQHWKTFSQALAYRFDSERRGRLAADNRRGLVDELVILEGLHHEQGKVHAARDVALEDGVAHVPAPHR